MSAINNALSELSKSNSAKNSIEKADVKTVKQRSVLPWVIGGFTLSLAVGGWAISLQQPTQQVVVDSSPRVQQSDEAFVSPTAKKTNAVDAIYQAPKSEIALEVNEAKPIAIAQVDVAKTQTKVVEQPLQDVKETTIQQAPIPAKKPTVAPQTVEMAEAVPELADKNVPQVVIEQVELTPAQLADKAQERAKKALDSNNLAEATAQYSDALRYTPRDSAVRQKLAALYYGKGEARKAAELLQKGISLAKEDQGLRIALAKLLLKEKQQAAALSPLVYLPANPNVDYLSLRAALAQKNNQDQLAFDSYQQLVQLEPDSGRWWMGLAIQLERNLDIPKAIQAYQQALTKVGLSNQSQQFIRDRLALIQRLEEQPSAN
ncbi:tetratricopeptide repeat protein [Vibrio sp. LaRot3]|uniref:tetratricopeptide repeat protein n=1 Tax=Vibrio sp. LaRot3 TaxID=2998829 RepID=UPI0022CE302C|nr:MSHA biogenesis protein MshN [Vibrio sp. LaRot3]MDA0148566.1 MSHA biogenesis protein MshN [Vibrio sp. LaRot3]